MAVSLMLPAVSHAWDQQDDLNMREDYNNLQENQKYLDQNGFTPHDTPQEDTFRDMHQRDRDYYQDRMREDLEQQKMQQDYECTKRGY